jgi:hypothetical protein
MIGAWVALVYIDEQPMMVHNDHVIHYIYFFLPIKPCAMCLILPWLVDLDQSAINEPNTIDKFLQMCTQGHLSSTMG